MKSTSCLALAAVFAVVGCAQDDHEHDVSEFATYDDCFDHYKGEGHTDAEADDFCESLKETA